MIRGIPQMRNKIREIYRNYPTRVERALFVEANIEMTEAKRRTPVDTTENAPHPGQLRASGTVHPPERSGQSISIMLSFGGAAKDYAIHVHENPDAIHPIGQWKFLESVLNESRSHMASRVGARLNLNKER